MLTKQELVQLGIVPPQYKHGKNIYGYPGFVPVQSVSHDVWKRLPLHIQVCYSYNQPHTIL